MRFIYLNSFLIFIPNFLFIFRDADAKHLAISLNSRHRLQLCEWYGGTRWAGCEPFGYLGGWTLTDLEIKLKELKPTPKEKSEILPDLI